MPNGQYASEKIDQSSKLAYGKFFLGKWRHFSIWHLRPVNDNILLDVIEVIVVLFLALAIYLLASRTYSTSTTKTQQYAKGDSRLWDATH